MPPAPENTNSPDSSNNSPTPDLNPPISSNQPSGDSTSPLPTQPEPTVVAPSNQPVVFSPTVSSSPTAGTASPQPSDTTGANLGTAPANNGSVASPGLNDREPKKSKRKLFIGIGAALVIIIGGLVAFYFLYWMSPSFVWKQSLGDTNTAYTKLLNYMNTASSTHYKGLNASGSFKYQAAGTSYNGSTSLQSDGSNSKLSLKVDTGLSTIDLEERSITAAGNTAPDVYVQVNGLNSLSSYLGPQISALGGKWIAIDHNLIIDLKNEVTKAQKSNTTPQLNWTDINSFLQSAGKVDKQYLFTTDKKTAVTKVIKVYGRENVNGHDTYHYKVGFVPANVKTYVTAMCSALQQSQLGSYIKSQTGSNIGASSTCKDLENSASKIKSTDTVDVWADVKTRLIYKVRVFSAQNPAQNFVDFGLNYNGKGSFPFFISGQDKSGSSSDKYSFNTTLNTKNNSVAVAINASSKGSSPYTFSGNFSFSPTNDSLSLTAPKGAVPVTTVLNELGLGAYVTGLQQLGTNQQLSSVTPLTTLPTGPNAATLQLVNYYNKL